MEITVKLDHDQAQFWHAVSQYHAQAAQQCPDQDAASFHASAARLMLFVCERAVVSGSVSRNAVCPICDGVGAV